MADVTAQEPTQLDTPIVINETIALNIDIIATITYKQVPPAPGP